MVLSDPPELRVTDQIDLGKIPVEAMRQPTLLLLSAMLNKHKIFTSEEGYHRDWRGLFQAISFDHHPIDVVKDSLNPTEKVMQLWQSLEKEAKLKPNLGQLQQILGIIDRWDVMDDSRKLMYEDAEHFLAAKHKLVDREAENQTISERYGETDEIITKDDTLTKKQIYDAFILYADSDIEFASRIINRLEEKNLKVCIRDRDILGGSFEHKTIMKLITERCRRLVVVISKEFLKTPLNEFFVIFAQAMQIEQKTRKIIPCVYERLDLPPNLKYYFILDYKRSNKLYNFWDKLEEAVRCKEDLSEDKNLLISPEVPQITIDAVDQSASQPPAESSRRYSEEMNRELKTTIPKAASTWDIQPSGANLKPPGAHSSISDSNLLSRTNSLSSVEVKKSKNWLSKIGISINSKSQENVSDRTEKKKKRKWYKSNKNLATAE
ncbi:myeloid differentiation primary response protein MyD88 [Uranotaenia lowii]|uniref:myeloid differentiation primary response protein MyD88 n=1 Tax=Uranotaenia lowii TaxID=190385 RepID=UPI002478AF71|nr:myeloid differentiation primary response protein MyD88 [Uranotaenia lowii]